MTNNPVLVEVTRGGTVESFHRGAIAVCEPSGSVVFATGDTDKPIFPRSATKAILALPLIESGAADAFGFSDAELSLACSSHSGEEEHVRLVRDMLSRADVPETCLECGGHWSLEAKVMRDQARYYEKTPPAVCNNCSGKHAGFLCTASHNGVDPKGYVNRSHKIQQDLKGVMESVTGVAHEEDLCGIDGCSIPTYAIPLTAMATGFAKMASGDGLEPERAKAADRLLKACMAEPFYMAGSRRFCTKIMEVGAGRLFAKIGAEGVYCAAIPELGLGIALKCDDGTMRAAETMVAATFAKLLPDDDPLQPELKALAISHLKNWNGIEVGQMRAVLTAN